MDIFKINGVSIDGIVSCMPHVKTDNLSALRELYGDEADIIVNSTGIQFRYAVPPGTTSSDMCIACAERLMQAAHIRPEEIGGVVFVTFTPDRRMPFNAATAQHKLKLNKEIPAFDLSLACSGYPYGLYIAALLCASCQKKVLLLNGDAQTPFVSKLDKAVFPVLSDGGSATLLSAAGGSSEWKFTFYTDGAGRDALTIPAGGSERPETIKDLDYQETADGSQRRNIDISMDGFAVFRFVALDIAKWLAEFMQANSENAGTIDSFVPHQANMFMIKKLAKKLQFDWNSTWQSGDVLGNPASASVPITIAYGAHKYLKPNKTNKVLLSGFGAGLSASAGIITLSPDTIYDFFIYKKKGESHGKIS